MPYQLKARAYRVIQHILAPARCMHCQHLVTQDTIIFCPQCAGDIYPIEDHNLCERCGHPLQDEPGAQDRQLGGFCTTCDCTHPHYDQVRSLYRYDGVLHQTIQHIKYGRREADLARFNRWAIPAMVAQLQHWQQHLGPLTICPIAPTRKTTWHRGFHLPSVLARDLHLLAPIKPSVVRLGLLRRHGKSKAQAGLSREARMSNVHGDFYCRDEVSGAVCLLDDVMTTGATLDDAARALKSRGASTVVALTICRRMTKL